MSEERRAEVRRPSNYLGGSTDIALSSISEHSQFSFLRAKRQARLREQILLGLLGLGLPEPPFATAIGLD